MTVDDVTPMLKSTVGIKGRVASLGRGDYCDAYLIGDDVVVRVARHPEADAALERERCLLPIIAKRVSLSVPLPLFAGRDPKTGRSFLGTTAIHGVPLTVRRYDALPGPLQERVVDAVLEFLTKLHSVDLSMARACGVAPINIVSSLDQQLPEIATHVFSRCQEPVAEYVQSLVERHSLDGGSYEQVLLHGDLEPDHIYLDVTRGVVSGVIDFGDLQIGDSDSDLRFLYEDFSAGFVASMFRHLSTEARLAKLAAAELFSTLDTILWVCERLNRDAYASVGTEIAELDRRARNWLHAT